MSSQLDMTADLRRLSTFRGCVTNGEAWVFFVFNASESGEGGTVSISDEFRLNEDLSGLPLILGLLSDWVSFNHVPHWKVPTGNNLDHQRKRKRAAVFHALKPVRSFVFIFMRRM